MSPRSPGAFLLSATFHVLVVGVACLFALDSCESDKTPQHVLELVQGEGDNYGATVAPNLGSPTGVKLDVPSLPTPKTVVTPVPTPPTPPPPTPEIQTPPPQPTPKVTPAPKPPPKTAATATKTPDVVPNFKKQIQRKVIAAEWRAKREIARERAAEEKRQKELERERLAREKSASANATSHIAHIDGKGIAKGVVGGKSENTVGGAGGTALESHGAVLDQYYAYLKQKIRAALDKPAGLSDDLVVTIDFHISASGHISDVQVVKSSGSTEWDRAVVQAFNRVTMPEHPEHKGEDLELDFRTKETD